MGDAAYEAELKTRKIDAGGARELVRKNLTVQKLIQDTGLDAANQYVFVSVDSQRDTSERLAQYVAFFNPKLVGATGSDDALKTLTQELGVFYAFPEGKKGKAYAVEHSSIVALFDPDARLHAVFNPPLKAEGIADGFRRILGRGQ